MKTFLRVTAGRRPDPVPRNRRGMSLLEAMAYIAIAGLVAAVVIPGIQKARNNAALQTFPDTLKAIRISVDQLAAKPGGLGYPPVTEGANLASFTAKQSTFATSTASVFSNAFTIDQVLAAEQLLDKSIRIGIGSKQTDPTGTLNSIPQWDKTNNQFVAGTNNACDVDYSNIVRIECALMVNTTPGLGTNFYLDPSQTNLPAGSRIAYIAIPKISGSDAASLANALAPWANATSSTANLNGPVAYAAPNTATGLTTATVFVGIY